MEKKEVNDHKEGYNFDPVLLAKLEAVSTNSLLKGKRKKFIATHAQGLQNLFELDSDDAKKASSFYYYAEIWSLGLEHIKRSLLEEHFKIVQGKSERDLGFYPEKAAGLKFKYLEQISYLGDNAHEKTQPTAAEINAQLLEDMFKTGDIESLSHASEHLVSAHLQFNSSSKQGQHFQNIEPIFTKGLQTYYEDLQKVLVERKIIA